MLAHIGGNYDCLGASLPAPNCHFLEPVRVTGSEAETGPLVSELERQLTSQSQ
jgi:hypothetical protein